MVQRGRMPGWICLAWVCLAGCTRSPEPEFESSQTVLGLPSQLQSDVRAQVLKHAGTYAHPQLIGHAEVPERRLKRGQAVYQERCVQCHGVTGDGNGLVASAMYPRPRDYRRGIFKFTSTPYGAKPLRADLVRTVMRGVPGTSMPAFKLLPREDVEATVDYVLALTLRGELEEQVAITAEAEEEIDPLTVQDETLPYLVSNWKQASQQEVRPVTPQPEFTREHVQRGREAFLTKGCSKCHGDDGRGLTADNLKAGLKDVWGFPTRAADLTSGMLRGGFEPEDVYRRIYSGINGTPMPAFSTTLAAEPDTLWDLVAYVLHVSGTRRRGAIPVPPPFLPYVPADAVSEGG